MSPPPSQLVNADAVDALPAHLLTPRRNADARILSLSRWLLRRKRDGRFLATVKAHADTLSMQPLHACTSADLADLHALLALLGLLPAGPLHPRIPAPLLAMPPHFPRSREVPTTSLLARLTELAVEPAAYADRTGLPIIAEPATLAFAGRDRYLRPLWLDAPTARAWQAMRTAAAADGITLDAISGFRSHAYQLGIFQRKLARGQSVEQILAVNAAPGFSEHHSGRALDIGTPGEPPAEESFERTQAFSWLTAHADRFGFRMSYPRHNPHGIVYEPWHWYLA
jgi:zinc D-Ala-D-Ala carboxypeptidase